MFFPLGLSNFGRGAWFPFDKGQSNKHASSIFMVFDKTVKWSFSFHHVRSPWNQLMDWSTFCIKIPLLIEITGKTTVNTVFETTQCTVVGGGDKTSMVIRTDWSRFNFFGSFCVYFEEKLFLNIFKAWTTPLNQIQKSKKWRRKKFHYICIYGVG